MAGHQLPKLGTRVRFPFLAPWAADHGLHLSTPRPAGKPGNPVRIVCVAFLAGMEYRLLVSSATAYRLCRFNSCPHLHGSEGLRQSPIPFPVVRRGYENLLKISYT